MCALVATAILRLPKDIRRCTDGLPVQIKRWAAERPGWAITSLYMTASNFSSAPTGASTITRFLKPRLGSPLPATSAPGQQQQQPPTVHSPIPSMSGQPVQSASPHPRHLQAPSGPSMAPSAAEKQPEEPPTEQTEQAHMAKKTSGELVAAAALQRASDTALPADMTPSFSARVAAEEAVSGGAECNEVGDGCFGALGRKNGAQLDRAAGGGKQEAAAQPQASCSLDAPLLLHCPEEVCWEPPWSLWSLLFSLEKTMVYIWRTCSQVWQTDADEIRSSSQAAKDEVLPGGK